MNRPAANEVESEHAAGFGLLGQWREANRLASEAERLLFDASMLYSWGQGPRPSPEQRREAVRIRRGERDLFNAVMLEFRPRWP